MAMVKTHLNERRASGHWGLLRVEVTLAVAVISGSRGQWPTDMWGSESVVFQKTSGKVECQQLCDLNPGDCSKVLKLGGGGKKVE